MFMRSGISTRALVVGAALALAIGCEAPMTSADAAPKTSAATSRAQTNDTFEQSEIDPAVADFFGITAEAAGQLVERVFRENGRPNIRGEEGSAALGVGVRYGEGNLRLKNGQTQRVFWQGPSIGFDTGANASKALTLVDGLHDSTKIFQRFAGVEGSAYLVGGVGVNYQRAGVSLRAGANVGYLAYTRERHVLPL